MSMAVTNPHTFEESTFQTCKACGILFHANDDRPCDCEIDDNGSSEQCHV